MFLTHFEEWPEAKAIVEADPLRPEDILNTIPRILDRYHGGDRADRFNEDPETPSVVDRWLEAITDAPEPEGLAEEIVGAT